MYILYTYMYTFSFKIKISFLLVEVSVRMFVLRSLIRCHIVIYLWHRLARYLRHALK